MTFESLVEKSWNEHADNAAGVRAEFPSIASLVQSTAQMNQLSSLATHVYGEHLGEWNEGIEFLSGLKAHSCNDFESKAGLDRSIASLQLCAGKMENLNAFGLSDRIRILCVSASALSGQSMNERAVNLFQEALSLASQVPDSDPAVRSLAITGNNLASSLETLNQRSSFETEFMVTAAQAARKFWEKAGTWLNVERAEYRLCHSLLKAGRAAEALQHANACLAICEANQASALEFFFGYEARWESEIASGKTAEAGLSSEQARFWFDRLTQEDQAWCFKTMQKIESK